MNFTALFVRRPVMTTLLMIGILVFGIVSYQKLPVSDLPVVDSPTIGLLLFVVRHAAHVPVSREW